MVLDDIFDRFRMHHSGSHQETDGTFNMETKKDGEALTISGHYYQLYAFRGKIRELLTRTLEAEGCTHGASEASSWVRQTLPSRTQSRGCK